MKKRTGFVSNSSSSSFCLLGVTSEDIMKVNTAFNDETDWYDFDEDDGLSVESGISDYEGFHCRTRMAWYVAGCHARNTRIAQCRKAGKRIHWI